MYWLAAKTLALSGQTIARSIWMDRYLYHTTGIWMLQIYDPVTGALGAQRVVQSGDFGLSEFQAGAWIQHGAVVPVIPPPAAPVYYVPVIRIQIVFAAAVDDDVCLTVGGVVVYNPRRNLGWYETAVGGVWPPHPTIDLTVGKNGDYVQIDCADGWGPNYSTSAWTAYVYLNGVLTQTVTGGITTSSTPDGAPTPSGGWSSAYYAAPPTLNNYFSMGGFTISVF